MRAERAEDQDAEADGGSAAGRVSPASQGRHSRDSSAAEDAPPLPRWGRAAAAAAVPSSRSRSSAGGRGSQGRSRDYSSDARSVSPLRNGGHGRGQSKGGRPDASFFQLFQLFFSSFF